VIPHINPPEDFLLAFFFPNAFPSKGANTFMITTRESNPNMKSSPVSIAANCVAVLVIWVVIAVFIALGTLIVPDCATYAIDPITSR